MRRFSWKNILYTLCFFWFCVIDQRVKTGSGLDGVIETFRDSMGVVMGCMILSHYRWQDFRRRRIPCMVWGAVGTVASAVMLVWGWKSDRVYFGQCVLWAASVILFGFVLIHLFLDIKAEKKCPALCKGFAVLWTVMMLYMFFSRSHYVWPLFYLILFGCFYLTDFTKEEQASLFAGMLNGLILAFFILQGLCFAFRPYDHLDFRYVGIHSNSNQNAIFYMEVLAAVLVKLLLAYRANAKLWIKLFYWTGSGVLLSFLFMTIGRTAWLVTFVMCVIFLVAMDHFRGCRRLIRNGLILVLCFCLTFPLCFGAVRYLPPLFHHPVWFWGEWSEEKVHSWDPWDSEKFVDIDEFMKAALGRISYSVQNFMEHSPFLLRAEATGESQETETYQDTREQDAVLTPEQGGDSLLVRTTIYRHYLKNLNILGQPYEEQGFQLTRYYWIGHAHNIFLQFGTDFGIPVLLSMLVLCIWSAVIYGRRIRREKTAADVVWLFFLIIAALFGMLEYSWGVGSLSLTMLFVAWKWAANTEKICISEQDML